MSCYQIPILRFLLPYLLGILLIKISNQDYYSWTIGSIIIILATSLFLKKSNFQIILIILLNFLIPISCSSIAANNHQKLFNHYNQKLDGEIIIQKITKQNNQACSFTFAVNYQLFLCHLSNKTKTYFPADTLVVQNLKIQKIDLSDTAFIAYKTHLLNKGIVGTSFLKEAQIQKVKEGNGVLKKIYQLRNFITRKIHQSKVFKPREESIFLSLLLGEKSYLSKETKIDYVEAGVIHVLAISGLHVGIIFLFLQSFFKLSPYKNKYLHFFSITTLLCFYAILSGLGASVLRACIMFIIIQFSSLNNTKIPNINVMLNIVFTSAYFLLLFNPNYIYDVGFQLSYSAVIFIIIGLRKTKNLIAPLGKITKKVSELFTVNCFAFLGTYPLLLFHLNYIYFGSVLCSLLVVPLISIVVLIGVVGILLIPFEAVFYFLLLSCNYILLFINNTISFFAKYLSGQWIFSFDIKMVIISYSLISVLLFKFKSFSKKLIYTAILLSIFILLI